MLPHYLKTKLATIGINHLDEFKRHDVLRVFQWLKYQFPSISYKALFDLYSITHSLAIGSLSKEFQISLREKYKQLLPSYPPLPSNVINKFLHQAQQLAAKTKNEVPIGAVVVKQITKSKATDNCDNFIVIGQGHNLTLSKNNIFSHAEIIALTEAQKFLNNHRLDGCDLYVTIEPCLMCMGAILHSRIRRIIFGAIEPKTGAILSQYQVLQNSAVNHQCEAIGPVSNTYYRKQIQNFMQQKR